MGLEGNGLEPISGKKNRVDRLLVAGVEGCWGVQVVTSSFLFVALELGVE